MYFVLLWADELKNKVVSIECDNSAAVSWLLKKRSKGGAAADVLAKLLVSFCLQLKITLMCKHIAGSLNTVADFRSRDLLYAPQDQDEALFELSTDTSRQLTRAEHCRIILFKAVTMPESLRGLSLLEELINLRGTHE